MSSLVSFLYLYICVTLILAFFFLFSASMAARPSLQPSGFFNSQCVLSRDRVKSVSKTTQSSNVNLKDQKIIRSLTKSTHFKGCFVTRDTPSHQMHFSVRTHLRALSSKSSDQASTDDDCSLTLSANHEVELSRVNSLVWVLHESARSFCMATEALQLARNGPQVAMAWVGIDVHAWHKRIAYQVAVYAMLKAAIEVKQFLSQKRQNSPSPVCQILSSNAGFLGERLDSQLKMRNPKLVQWFKTVELPRIAGSFMPMFKKWSMEYAGSGVAGTVLVLSCCAAIKKLGSGRISCPLFSASIEDAMEELMALSYNLVSLDKLHQLANEAGYEDVFLSHFGRKVLPSKSIEDLEFWIGLIKSKLCIAFERESLTTGKHGFHDKVQGSNLAILGLFAYLGRETRFFLSAMGIKDLDEQIKDFISYLECGSLLIFPELSALSEFQLFIEVVTDEIGWLDFYAAYSCKFSQEKRKSKQHANQAEKEIIMYTVLTVCYDIFSGFAHYSSSAKQALDTNLLNFLIQRDYCLLVWRTTGLPMMEEGNDSEPSLFPSLELPTSMDRIASGMVSSSAIKGAGISSSVLEAHELPMDVLKREKSQTGRARQQGCNSITIDPITPKGYEDSALHPPREDILRKSTTKLISASADMWMGTQLLLVDVVDMLGLLVKQLRGSKLTRREMKKVERTLADLATLIPVTILMLLPVSAIGHAAILAAIKKYMPSLIPSPYSSERLELLNQLKRTKKMEIEPRSSIETHLNKTFYEREPN